MANLSVLTLKIFERLFSCCIAQLSKTQCVFHYLNMLFQNTTVIAKPNYDGALFSHIRNGGVALMWENMPVDISGVFNFIRENIGIFQSVSRFLSLCLCLFCRHQPLVNELF